MSTAVQVNPQNSPLVPQELAEAAKCGAVELLTWRAWWPEPHLPCGRWPEAPRMLVVADFARRELCPWSDDASNLPPCWPLCFFDDLERVRPARRADFLLVSAEAGACDDAGLTALRVLRRAGEVALIRTNSAGTARWLRAAARWRTPCVLLPALPPRECQPCHRLVA